MRITIIGGGPGGYTAAFAAAQKGCKVTLVENQALGGTCLNRGCIPTKTLRASADALALARRLAEYGVTGCVRPAIDLEAVRRRKEQVRELLHGGLEKACARFRITRLQGTAQVMDAKQVLVHGADGDHRAAGGAVIIATGSRVLELPGLTFDHKFVLSSDEALKLERIPARLLIVGGGVVGCELASVYRAFGSEVCIVEGQDRLLPLPSVDGEISALLAREMRKQKIRQMTGKTLKDVRIGQGHVQATATLSPFAVNPSPDALKDEPLEADMVLVTVGRQPATEGLGLAAAGIGVDRRGWIMVNDRLETSVPGIYAIGDVLGPAHIMLAHVAAAEGLCVVDNLTGSSRPMRYDVVPSAVFTAPEIGEVGLAESQARAAYPHVVCGTFQTRELGKAQAMGELPGFFKLVADADSGRLLGAHCAGAHASDIIAEAALALRMEATVQDVADTIHAHPTLAEGFYEAARITLAALTDNAKSQGDCNEGARRTESAH